jgi:hypothetical protein
VREPGTRLSVFEGCSPERWTAGANLPAWKRQERPQSPPRSRPSQNLAQTANPRGNLMSHREIAYASKAMMIRNMARPFGPNTASQKSASLILLLPPYEILHPRVSSRGIRPLER